ncbi:MAG: DUF5663 domain-containing protein [Patescibacteria group bacterium]
MNEEQKNNLLEELGLEDLPEETQTRILEAMTESLLKRITLRILEELSEEDREEFEKIREEQDAQKTENFLREKIPNYDEIVEEVSSSFKEEMKGHINELKEGLEEDRS